MHDSVANFAGDAAVVAAGMAGLAASAQLAKPGCRVALIDEGDCFGLGASTKNEGWLHAGTYHSTSISDPTDAAEVARRCIYGFEFISSYAPAAIESGDATFAIVPEHLREHALSRWQACGITFAPATPTDLQALADDVLLAVGEQVFSVRDVGVNTRMLITLALESRVLVVA